MATLKDHILEIMGRQHLASLATVTDEGKPWVRYVIARGDGDLNLRFACFLDSRKVSQIKKNPEVHLTCGVTSPQTAESYLQVQGRAEVATDETERDAFWKEELRRYFGGPDDPNYCVVKVVPYRIEYMAPGSMDPEVWIC
jgi:general stress protein 26